MKASHSFLDKVPLPLASMVLNARSVVVQGGDKRSVKVALPIDLMKSRTLFSE